MHVSENSGFPPKMDGENNGKPYVQMDDLGEVHPLFLETPTLDHVSPPFRSWSLAVMVPVPCQVCGRPKPKLWMEPPRWVINVQIYQSCTWCQGEKTSKNLSGANHCRMLLFMWKIKGDSRPTYSTQCSLWWLSSTSCSKNYPLRIIYFSTKWIWVGEDSKAGYLWIFWAELSHPNSANGLGWWFGDSWRIPYEKDPVLKGVADSNWAKPPIYHHSIGWNPRTWELLPQLVNYRKIGFSWFTPEFFVPKLTLVQLPEILYGCFFRKDNYFNRYLSQLGVAPTPAIKAPACGARTTRVSVENRIVKIQAIWVASET